MKFLEDRFNPTFLPMSISTFFSMRMQIADFFPLQLRKNSINPPSTSIAAGDTELDMGRGFRRSTDPHSSSSVGLMYTPPDRAVLRTVIWNPSLAR